MGTHLRVLSDSNPIYTDIVSLVFEKSYILVLWTKVKPLALEGLSINGLTVLDP